MAALTILKTTEVPIEISAGNSFGPYNVVYRVNLATVSPSPAATDTIDFGWVPAGYRVTRVVTRVVRPAGATCTVAIGDFDDSNSFIPSVDANAAIGTRVESVALYTALNATYTEGGGGKSFPVAKQLRLLLNNTNAVAILDIGVTIEKLPL